MISPLTGCIHGPSVLDPCRWVFRVVGVTAGKSRPSSSECMTIPWSLSRGCGSTIDSAGAAITIVSLDLNYCKLDLLEVEAGTYLSGSRRGTHSFLPYFCASSPPRPQLGKPYAATTEPS